MATPEVHEHVPATGRCSCGLPADDCNPLVISLCERVLEALRGVPGRAAPADAEGEPCEICGQIWPDPCCPDRHFDAEEARR